MLDSEYLVELWKLLLGAASTEFGVGVFGIIDGTSRIGANSVRLAAYLSGHKDFGDTLPGNLGGLAGKLADGNADFYQAGTFQNLGSLANDGVTLFFTGTKFEYSPYTGALAGGVLSDAYTIISDYSSVVTNHR